MKTAGYVKDLFTIKKQYCHDEELLEMIDTILETVERCGTITSQLLSFSRKFDLRISRVALETVYFRCTHFSQKKKPSTAI